jgi:HIRAN domain
MLLRRRSRYRVGSMLRNQIAGQALMLVREPQNHPDPDAVLVCTLQGEELGYVPREQTSHFVQSVSFARVSSVSRETPTATLGVKVMSWDVKQRMTPSNLLEQRHLCLSKAHSAQLHQMGGHICGMETLLTMCQLLGCSLWRDHARRRSLWTLCRSSCCSGTTT